MTIFVCKGNTKNKIFEHILPVFLKISVTTYTLSVTNMRDLNANWNLKLF